MGCYCCAYNCKEIASAKQYSFHGFPKDPFLRKKWILAIKRKNFEPTDSTKICSKHFEPHCFYLPKFGPPALKKDAIPTLFDFSESIREKHQNKMKSHSCNPLVIKIKSEQVDVDEENDADFKKDNLDILFEKKGISNESSLKTQTYKNNMSLIEESFNDNHLPKSINLTIYVNKIYCSNNSNASKPFANSCNTTINIDDEEKLELMKSLLFPDASQFNHCSNIKENQSTSTNISMDSTSENISIFNQNLMKKINCKVHLNNYCCTSINDHNCNKPTSESNEKDKISLINELSLQGNSKNENISLLLPTSEICEPIILDAQSIDNFQNSLDDSVSYLHKKQFSLDDFSITDMSNPIKAKLFYSIATKMIYEQQEKIKLLHNIH